MDDTKVETLRARGGEEHCAGCSSERTARRRSVGVARPEKFSLWAAAAWLLLGVPGCSLLAMGGRMILGDTAAKSQFEKATRTNLVKSDAKVLVLCSATDSIRSRYPSVEFDVLDSVTRQIKGRGVNVVSPNAVAGWLDDHGGRFDDLKVLAEHFHAEYVIHIDLSKFTCIEENSPNLLRGNSEGHVQAYRLEGDASQKRLLEVMNSDFASTFPQGHPVPIDTRSAKNFTRDYIDRVSLQLAQIFYDHPMSEEIQ